MEVTAKIERDLEGYSIKMIYEYLFIESKISSLSNINSFDKNNGIAWFTS